MNEKKKVKPKFIENKRSNFIEGFDPDNYDYLGEDYVEDEFETEE